MKRVFNKSRTMFEKIFIWMIILSVVALFIASNVNLDILVYAGFGTYVVLGLLAFFRPRLLFEIILREHEEYLVRNQRKIPLIKSAIRLGGFTLAVMGVALTYIFIVIF